MAEIERKRSFFHPLHGWTDSPDGAVIRIESQVRWEAHARPEVAIYRKDADNSWSVVLDDDVDIRGVDRGLYWQSWKTSLQGRRFLAFRGLRPIDDALASLLDGLAPHSFDGDKLTSPLDCGYLFLLSDHDAREFSRRVIRDQGGKIELVSPTAGRAEQLLRRLRRLLSEIEEMREIDAETVARCRENDFSTVAAFQERTALLRARFQQVIDIAAEVEREVAPLRTQERGEEERVSAEQAVREARRFRLASQAEREARDEDASEVAFLQAVAQGTARREAPRLRRSAAIEVGLAAQRAGHAVEETADGVRIQIGSKTLIVGPGFDVV